MGGRARGWFRFTTRGAVGFPALVAAWVVLAPPRAVPDPDPVQAKNILAHEEFLASDALHGRGSGTRDEWIAAVYIGSELRQYGVEPAGDADADGRPGYVQAVPPGEGRAAGTWNAVGVLKGSDPKLAGEAVLLSAHLDHLGTDERLQGDRIFNGADDDASGVTAVLELARALGVGAARPRRTVYFVCFGSEETGGAGAAWFLDHPPIPLERMVANLEFEMIGRPDKAVPKGTLWLTGWERSDLGPELARQGARLVGDPHPEQNFFARSDNIALARRGVVAQTVSSFGLHPQYHRPDDDLAHLDVPHMTEAIGSMVKPVRWLANGDFQPRWNPGKKP